MKKILWTDDVATIRQEIDTLVQEKTGLVCGRRGLKNITRLVVIAKTEVRDSTIFVLLHPHEPSCGSDTCTFYYHRPGFPLRFFACRRVKKAGDYVGYELPERIFYIHRRKHDRVTTPHTSTITFSLLQKQRIYNGKIDDISIQGAKVLVNIPMELAAGTKLFHITITLCLRESLVQTVLFVAEAEIVWSKCAESLTTIIGIRFAVAGNHLEALTNYIDLRLIEDARKGGEPQAGLAGTAPAQPKSLPIYESPFVGEDADDDDIPLF